MITVQEVHFNHDNSSSTADAINIRYNQVKNTAITAPEWVKGKKLNPAAYALKQVNGGRVTIKARFSGGAPNSAIKIRALDYYDKPAQIFPGWAGPIARMPIAAVRVVRTVFAGVIFPPNYNQNLLGSVKEKTISFDSNGESKLEEFELVGHKLKPSSGVGSFSTVWDWQQYTNGKWLDFSRTSHKIYAILDHRAGPWNQIFNSGHDNSQLPWIIALDVACVASQGAKTADEIAEKITKWVNDHPLLVYHPNNNFAARGATAWDQFNTAPYLLSVFLAELQKGKTIGLNCLDCANAVIALSNLLGSNLVENPLSTHSKSRPIVAVGGDESKHSEWKEHQWQWHAVAWKDHPNFDAYIYDATLKLDLDLNKQDQVHKPHQPIKMKFGYGRPNEKNYINYLLQNTSTYLTGNWYEFPMIREVK